MRDCEDVQTRVSPSPPGPGCRPIWSRLWSPPRGRRSGPAACTLDAPSPRGSRASASHLPPPPTGRRGEARQRLREEAKPSAVRLPPRKTHLPSSDYSSFTIWAILRTVQKGGKWLQASKIPVQRMGGWVHSPRSEHTDLNPVQRCMFALICKQENSKGQRNKAKSYRRAQR